MHAEEHLRLRPVCLKGSGDWTHKQAGLVFVFSQAGAGNYKAGGFACALGRDDVLIANAGKEGKISAVGSSEVSFFCFFLNLEHLFPLFGAEEVSALGAVTEALQVPKLYKASSPIARRCHQLVKLLPDEYNLEHRSQLLSLAVVLLSEEFNKVRQQKVPAARRADQIDQALASLSADQFLTYSVGEWAVKLGCSRRHLSRVFNERFGLSVAALRMEMRMMKATTLLRDPDAKVLIIAQQCGFNHLGLFNTCFKKRFGVSPTQWRRQSLPVNGVAVPAAAASGLHPLAPTVGGESGAAPRRRSQGAEPVLPLTPSQAAYIRENTPNAENPPQPPSPFTD